MPDKQGQKNNRKHRRNKQGKLTGYQFLLPKYQPENNSSKLETQNSMNHSYVLQQKAPFLVCSS